LRLLLVEELEPLERVERDDDVRPLLLEDDFLGIDFFLFPSRSPGLAWLREAPDFFPPPVNLLTVAQPIRAAAFRPPPRFFTLSSM